MYIFSPKNSFNNSPKGRWRIKIHMDWKKIGKIAGIVCGGLFLIVAGVFAWYAKDLPSPGKLNTRQVIQSTKIYDRTGTTLLYEIHGEEKRTEIPFSQMPETLKYATIALEDQNFYTNKGIELTSIIRAGIADLLRRSATQGASTITQQLVKQTLLTSEKSLPRKIKEAILSLEISQKYSKDDILGMYLNQIPYGSNAYGVEAAAQTFFGKHAGDLTLPESALLASLPQAPSYYSPYGNHTDDLKARQEYALDQMAKLGYITKDQAEEAKQVDVLSEVRPFSENIVAPHFVMYVKDYLEQKYGEQTVEQGGLKVYTTLDWGKQQAAEQAISDNADKNAKAYRANNESLVAMDPNTGQILAMVGSKDYFGAATPAGCISGKNCTFEGNFNVATALRQPGSSFKPYVYLTAFEKGYTPETNIWDVDTNFSTDKGQTYTPKDYDGKNRGLMQMKDALAMSLNIPAVETLYLAGVNNSINTAHQMGITTLNDPSRYGLSLVLGGGEIELIDHVNAFSTFATGGIYRPKVAILKVEDSSGNILEQYKPTSGQRVVDEKYVAMIDYILSTNSLRAPIFGNNSPLAFTGDRSVAAKTGTTNEWRDGWTIGYTPSLVAGVWAGNNDNSPMAQGADGVFTAGPIWREFMNKALNSYSIEKFPEYKQEDTGKDVLDGKLSTGNDEIKVCEIPGSKGDYCLANDNCPNSEVEKKKFTDAHSILYYVNKDNPQGDAPKDPSVDPEYKNWEKAVSDYLKGKKGSKDTVSSAPPTDECSASDFNDKFKASVNIDSPSDGSTSTAPFTIKVSADAPFGISKLSLSINGSEVSSTSNSSLSYDYSSSGSSSLDIKADVTDNKGNTDTKKISVKANIP